MIKYCVICNRGVEDEQHLFHIYRKVREIWKDLLFRMGYRRFIHASWSDELSWVVKESVGKGPRNDVLRLVFNAHIYHIW